MKPMVLAVAVIAVAVAVLVSCAQQPRGAGRRVSLAAVEVRRFEGTITQVDGVHGNVYTSIGADQYEALGLVQGRRVRVEFADRQLTLVLGRDYTDVPRGTPVAVLHREGLTFALRDGDFTSTYGVAVGETFRISPVAPGE